MPRRRQDRSIKQKLRQDTLDTFVGSSSPIPADTHAKTPSPARKIRQARTTTLPSRDRQDRSQAKADTNNDPDEGSESSDVAAIHFEPQVIDLTEEEDEPAPVRPIAQKRKTRIRRAGSEEHSVSSQEAAVGVPVIWKGRKASGKRRLLVSTDDEDKSEPRYKQRKLIKGVRPPSPEADELGLMDEVDENKIIESRLRTRAKKSTFQKNLEKLKRKKRGEAIYSESSSSEHEEADDDTPFTHARPDAGGDSDSPDEHHPNIVDEDAFIVEDDNTAVVELPAEFSMGTYQDLIHHFKIICQLFVHLAVHNVEDRRAVMEQLLDKEYFSVPLQIARRKIIGMRDSLVTSSVWRPEFKRPLEMYPIFETTRLDFAIPACDACHLGGRMSTLLGRVSGTPYDKISFRPLEESGNSDSEQEDSNDEEMDVKKEFHLGRFCAARTRVFHSFTHWEYTLFGSLCQEVDVLRDSTRGFVRVAYARGKQPPADLSDADGIMDWLDERGIINMEWHKIKEMMESARHLEANAKRGEDVD
ncbi:hypothetical protein AcW1_005745 [Taiwanofungus camphoratus]|nr:hypothetical protein AcW2_004508 [Antrodia cinnamomea]KAI0934117.1 hypothetical protein AcV5_006071 [Antrodia cinnamomea]KAI0950582.1 hypothetical protein AcV7_009001 [Antrodia cinnamomea]KAI0957312.1 hypothetical protein AcW1_005745 [Antrodia cinnamomea]